MAVYDCCPFFNENDLLELRLNQHWDHVDKFIIVEATQTHTGLSKPFNYDVKRFKKYDSKIIYIQIKDFKQEIEKDGNSLLDDYSLHDRSRAGQCTEDWIRDHFQGNYPIKVLREMGAKDSDIIYLSAVDEILNERAFKEGIEIFSKDTGTYQLKSGDQLLVNQDKQPAMSRPSFGFNLDMYVYKLNLFSKKIDVAQMAEFSLLDKVLPSTVRSLSLHTHKNIQNAGWHFSWLDDTDGEKVLEKQKSWAHSRDILPNQKIKFEHQNAKEALDRLFTDYFSGTPPQKVEITREAFPKYLVENLDEYKRFIA